MDGGRFDDLARALGGRASRRAAVAGAFAAVTAICMGRVPAEAKKKRKKGCTAKKADCGPPVANGCHAGCDYSGASLRQLDLRGANFTGAILFNASLWESGLVGANLTDADLRQANLWYADLTNAVIAGADFTDAAFCFTKWVDGAYRYDGCSAP